MKKSKLKITLLLLMILTVSLTPMNVFAATAKAPAKVSLSKATVSASNKVTISWKKASRATKYRIMYKTYGAKSWKIIANVSSKKLKYTHTSSSKYPLRMDKKYVYTVRAYSSKARKWGKYNAKGLTATIPATPSKVTLASINAKADSVTISWKKASYATNYRIYYKTGNKSWQAITTVNASSLKYTHKTALEPGEKYTYTVKAYNSKYKKWGGYDTKGLSVIIPEAVSHEHDYDPATCTKPATCKICGATNGEALGHDFGDNNETCSRCGAINPDYVPNHEHSYDVTITKQPTCGTPGIKTYRCSCGATYTESIPATGEHDYSPATCTEPAKCTVCGATKGDPLGHDYVETFDSRPTTHCEGFRMQECSRCEDLIVTKTPMLTTPDITEEEVYDRLMKCKEQYPDRTPWGRDKYYFSDYACIDGIGCQAFALMIADTVFENRCDYAYGDYGDPAKYVDTDKIKSGEIPLRVGDIIFTTNHASVVLKVEGNNVITTDGNLISENGGIIKWFNSGLTIDDIYAIWTRY